MILTNSPYYLSIPWKSPASETVPNKYIIQIYVWNGLKAEPPTSPTYEVENENPLLLTGSNDVNISPFVNDVLKVNLNKGNNTGVTDADCAVWVKTEVIYYINDVAQSAQFTSTDLAVKGYGYGIEGKNTTIPANNVLAFGEFVNVSRFSQFTLPIKISEVSETQITIISYPDNDLEFLFDIGSTSESNKTIQNLFVVVGQSGADNRIEIKKNGILIHTLNIVDELRYTPFDVYFVNKYGALSSMSFFKEVVNTLKVTSEKYESSAGQPNSGVHQLSTYNKKATKEFKAKTGFILEENNEIIKQLLFSQSVWILEGNLFNPVNITTNSLEEQTRQKDRLLNYELSFEYAYNEINNI